MAARVIPVSRITPARRREMQRAYESVGRLLAADRALDALPLAAQCVAADPDGRLYVERLLLTLEQVWPTRPEKGSLSERARSWFGVRQLNKLASASDWLGTFHHGLSLLKEEPFALLQTRLQLLVGIAKACRESSCFDSEIAWLQGAQQLQQEHDQPQGLAAAVEEQLANAHLRRGDLDRVDAIRAVHQSQQPPSAKPEKCVEVAELKASINADPADVEKYLALAEHYTMHNEFPQAEAVLTQARFVEPSPRVTLALENVQISIARGRIREAQLAHEVAADNDRAAAASAVEQLQNECWRIECEINRSRRDRDPQDFESRLRLAKCLLALGNREAARTELSGDVWPAHMQNEVASLLQNL